MTILLLGHTGFIGKSISKIFKENNFKIIEISRNEIDFNIRKSAKDLARRLSRNISIIMCIGIKKQYGDNINNWVKNEVIFQNFIKSIIEQPPKHIVFFSSASIYGEDIDFQGPICESTQVNLRSYYGISKFNHENILKKICLDYHIPLICLRPPLIYGVNDSSLGYGPTQFTYQSINKEMINIWGDGTEKREFIYVDDLAYLCKEIIQKQSTGTLNTVSGISYSYSQIINELEVLLGIKIKLSYKERSKDKVDHHFSSKLHKKMFPNFIYTDLNTGLKKLKTSFENKKNEKI